MTLSGGCLCGAVRFEAEGEIRMRGLCLCKTCQKVSGGGGNYFIGLMADGFRYSKGEPSRFALTPEAPAREFCGACGVQLFARSPRAPEDLDLPPRRHRAGTIGRRTLRSGQICEKRLRRLWRFRM